MSSGRSTVRPPALVQPGRSVCLAQRQTDGVLADVRWLVNVSLVIVGTTTGTAVQQCSKSVCPSENVTKVKTRSVAAGSNPSDETISKSECKCHKRRLMPLMLAVYALEDIMRKANMFQ